MQDGLPRASQDIKLSAASASRIVLYVQFVISWFPARIKPDAAERSRAFADNLSNARPTAGSPLGGVDSRDSLLGANQIQGCFWGGSLGCDGTVGFERRGVGA